MALFPGPSRKVAAPRQQAPIWREDLRSFGYGGNTLPQEFPSHSVLDPISFLSDGTLMAAFVTRGAVATAPHRDQPDAALPLTLRAIFLDAATGGFRSARGWSAPYPGSVAIVAAKGGRLVVANREHLTLYSQGLEPLRELTLPTPAGPQGDLLSLEPSPQRGSLLVVYLRGRNRINWINADTLTVICSWGGSMFPSGVSNSELASFSDVPEKSHGFLSEVLLRNRDGGSHVICRSWTGCGTPQFISNEDLVLYGPHTMSLTDLDGTTLFAQDFSDSDFITDWPSPFRPAVDGNRFAVAIWAHKGGSRVLDITSHSVLKRIMVFDVPSRRWIYTLDAKKQGIKTISGLALSPNGSLMAIMAGGIVEVYRLPPESASDGPAPQ